MKERLSASHQRCAPDERRSSEETTKHLASSETITLSELLTSENDCPLSSVLSLPLSKGATNTTTLSSTTAASPLPGQKFIPQQYAYPQQEALTNSNEAIALPDLNLQSQELAVRNQCNPQPDLINAPNFSSNRIFEMKEVPSFHELEVNSDSTRKAPEVLMAEKQFATRSTKVSFPIKFGENSRKRKRTDDVVKSPLQRKMEHLDKEKERRLRQTKCYEYLRSLVPCGSLKTDKANILEATVAYLTYIKETLGTSMDVINKNFLDEFERSKDFSE